MSDDLASATDSQGVRRVPDAMVELPARRGRLIWLIPFLAAAVSRPGPEGQLGEDRLQWHGEWVKVGSLPGFCPLVREKTESLTRVGAADDR